MNRRSGNWRSVKKPHSSGKSAKSKYSSQKATLEQSDEIRSSIIKSKDATEFLGNWIAFNAHYGAGREPEVERAMDAVRDGISSEAAKKFLDACRSEIALFNRLPPGDMRHALNADDFRRASTRHLAIVLDGTANIEIRASHLIGVVYQIRCNLMHGQKNMGRMRNQRLVRASNNVLNALWNAMRETREQDVIY